MLSTHVHLGLIPRLQVDEAAKEALERSLRAGRLKVQPLQDRDGRLMGSFDD